MEQLFANRNRSLALVIALGVIIVCGAAYLFLVPPQTDDRVQKENSATQRAQNENTEIPARSVTLTGKNFSFSQAEIRVKKGERVKIEFTSEQGFHDWVVDAFDARTEMVNTGDSTSVEFVADKSGSFEYYCSIGNHRANGMVGTLIVE
ncbi:hypothetical protein A2765_03140 [Candidatus Kaiserbacteria bacterium RIFCSPHIGHO2_01_FULL_56_24]|uniref:EfeO-type cupredoxin-like domain-containing protein n=1 Tax=Candidatus Kaiserbacteria bacterium RIFCSPHIGHO2_01_FULL_56_24 TaxID=1798487 RepID=A0A1F6DF85_9BACT|nr:MAG: hypothetical protein A2765_03140 [Candidatus Kaiserbacteria bacterium RIFCSPHIGHO2_01_FULL_56_24]